MLKKCYQNKLIRNIIILASGTAAAQGITLALSPVITRIYGPENYGVMGVFVAVLAIITPIAGLSYPIAMVLPKVDGEAKALAIISTKIALYISLFTGIILYFFDDVINKSFGIESISAFFYLIPIAMFIDVLSQIMQQWLIRKKEFRVSARIAVSQSLFLNIFKIGFGSVFPSAATLILLTVFGNALYTLQLFLGMRKWSSKENQIDKITLESTPKKVMYKYWDFALYRSPQVLVNSISQSLPVLILATLFGPAAAGFFALGKSVLSAPAVLIGNSVGNVFYPRIAELVNKGENPLKIINKATVATFLIGLIPFLVVMIFGKNIFLIVFGDKWGVAGEYAQWMALWVLMSLSARPVISSIPVIKMQGVFLIFELLFLFFKVAGLYVGSYVYNSSMKAVIFYSLITAISYLVLYISVVIVLSSKKRKI